MTAEEKQGESAKQRFSIHRHRIQESGLTTDAGDQAHAGPIHLTDMTSQQNQSILSARNGQCMIRSSPQVWRIFAKQGRGQKSPDMT